MWPFFTFHLGKYTIPMDPMGWNLPREKIGVPGDENQFMTFLGWWVSENVTIPSNVWG